MDVYITFVSNNLLLFVALIVISSMLLFNLFGARLRGYQSASPTEAIRMINHDDAIVLDVREDSEFNTGHILNSVHIPQGHLKARLAELEKHKGKPIIIGCRSGHRSAKACAVLKKEGFDTVYNLAGGVMAWQSANLPLIKK
ncbi:MAG: rhodanese-like domain-containing protein [Gammaproteobacteria bacterium]|nr:rhodanese-like domain-containing protein [Gammaproteobacteria bacterium]